MLAVTASPEHGCVEGNKKRPLPGAGSGQAGGTLYNTYWTVSATTVVCEMLPEVAVMVTFDVPAGVGAVPDDPQPAIKPAEASRTVSTPRMRRLANFFRRRRASSDPNGSSIAKTMLE